MSFERKDLFVRFGICPNQDIVTSPILVNSALWYDERGHEVSGGDLSAGNLREISQQLTSGEMFIVQPYRKGHAPLEGWQKFLAEHAAYIVKPDSIYELVEDISENGRKSSFTPLKRRDALKLFPKK